MKIRIKINQLSLFYILLILAAFLVTAITVATGAYIENGYKITVGEASPQRFIASREIENTMATERNKAEAEKAALDMKPLRKKDLSVNEKVVSNLSALLFKIDKIRAVYLEELLAEQIENTDPVILDPLEDEFQNAPDTPDTIEDTDDLLQIVMPPPPGSVAVTESGAPLMPKSAVEQLDGLQITLSDTQGGLLLDMDDEHYARLHESVRLVTDYILEQGVQEVDAKSLWDIQSEFGKMDISGEMQAIGYQIVSSCLEPNYVPDEEATVAARQEISSKYNQVFLRKNQLIVDQNVIVSEEAFRILDTLGYVSHGWQDNIVPAVTAVSIVGVLFGLCLFYIYTYHKGRFKHKKDAALLFTIYCVVIICVRFLTGAPSFALLPVFLFTMLAAMLIDSQLSVALNLFVTVVAMFIFKGGVEFFIFYTGGGLAVALLAKYTTERSHIFLVGLIASILNFALMFGLSYFIQKTYSPVILQEASYAAANGIFTVIVCMGSLPFWEGLFGVVTNIKLLDLTNPSKTVLRRLIIEAPGTYQHSLIVANLAETAAYDIGADAILARVGGYYHDIGKLKNPRYFAENLLGANPHDTISPRESVEIIVSHVRYGLTLAQEYKLPQVIKDIIAQHHGTSIIHYFYCKEKDAHTGEDKVNDADFRYPFEIPQFREAGIVMLADVVEASVRSMINKAKNPDEVESIIRKMIKSKMDDGQLLRSQFSIQDLEDVAKSFTRVFKSMYHERIAYPAIEEIKTEIKTEIKIKEAAGGLAD